MATSNFVKVDHLKVFVEEGVKPVCKTLFTKCFNDLKPSEVESSAWTLDRFLQSNKDLVLSDRYGRQKEWILYPISPVCTNIEKWDSGLLCYLLMKTCNLSKVLRTNLKIMKEYLDAIEKMGKSREGQEPCEDYLAELKSILAMCLSEIKDKGLQKRINELSDQLEKKKKTKKSNILQDNTQRLVLQKIHGHKAENTEMIDGSELDEFNDKLRGLIERVETTIPDEKKGTDLKQEADIDVVMSTELIEEREETKLWMEKGMTAEAMDQSQDEVMLQKL